MSLLHASVVAMLAIPAVLLGMLAAQSVFRGSRGEAWTGTLTRLSMLGGFSASALALVTYFAAGGEPQTLSLGAWFSRGEGGFAFDFLVDGASLGFALLATGLCGVVAAFSARYLRRDPGFHRYFVQLSLFVLGITVVALAGSIEALFVGWELLGLSSALLVGFFHQRRAPVVSAFRVFSIYRASDAAMLSAAVLLHHWAGSGSLAALFSGRSGADLVLSPEQVLAISTLLIAAVATKSALLPFSGWLPRAMEGPTPSSAVYYGALSIHAGCFLLLRAEPLLAQSTAAQVLAALAGGSTALYATVTGRVQTDVKSALAYASLTQVGIIVVEIAVGLTTLAFVHILGHASFRLLQFLSAPNILHDLHELENRLQDRIGADAKRRRSSYSRLGAWVYLGALERGFADAAIDRFLVAPFQWVVHRLDRFDRLLCGHRPTKEGRLDRRIDP